MTHPRHRILFVHHRPELGGAPQSLSYLIASLDKDEFEPHVFCPPGPAAELFRAAGAEVHTGAIAGFTHIWASVYAGRRWLLFARELARLPRHLLGLRRTLRRAQIDLVHLNDAPLIAAAWMARRRGLPVVWHLRSALPNGGRDRRSRWLRRLIRTLTVASIAINDDISRVYDLGSQVVPNSVDLERFRPGEASEARAALGLPVGDPVIAYFGFLYPSKGFRQFILTARQIRDAGIDATFLIVGGAVRGEAFFRTLTGRALLRLGLARNYEAEAYELVGELGLGGCVRFVPFTHETPIYFRASDIVVAPSQGPELGRPVIEAAASGVPVVCTGSRSGGGIVLPGRTGVLVDASGDGLFDAIVELLADPERRRALGRAARLHAEERFDAQRNTRRLELVYRSILPERRRTKVLFVHHRPQLGGAPASLAELIRNLDERYEPHVFCPAGPAAELFAEAGAVVHEGKVSMFAHPWDNPYSGLRWLVLGRELALLPQHLAQLMRLLRDEEFPLVHLNDSPLLAAAWAAHRNGAHVVWHLRSALANGGRDRRSRWIGRLIDRWGDAAIAIDADVAERFPIRLPVAIVHNSVRVPSRGGQPDELKSRLGLPSDRTTIGFAGFVRRPKGWPELVEAAEIVVGQGLPAHFVIMGGGVRPPEYFQTPRGRILELTKVLSDEETSIKQLVREKGLSSHFSFLPFTARTAEIYDALDVITFPNQGVGLGRPVLEAAMHGKPVVASGSATGAGVLLDGVTGLLLGDPTPAAIAEALARLIGDPELRGRLGRAAAAHARERFEPTANARAVERVYASLLTPDSDERGEELELVAAAS